MATKIVDTSQAGYHTIIGYLPGIINGSTTTSVESITNNGAAISYTYDLNGNIKTITENAKVIEYKYNELNEVIRENNAVLNKTIVYSYDVGGNIKNKTEYPYTTGTVGVATALYPYVYGDANWKDKLTSYNGKSITYDAIGNPLTYNGDTYNWEEGRQLAGLTGNGNNISYKYNDGGIRTSKTVNGVTTSYHLVGDKVTYETNGTDTMYYTYDGSERLISMNYKDNRNIVGGDSAIGIFQTPYSNSGVSIIDTMIPQTNTNSRALRLNSGVNVPSIYSTPLKLKTNTTYVVEFDYWSDADNAAFDVDLFPDDLPQNMPTAQKTLQHYSWEFSSNSANMDIAQLRFFNDRAIPNPGNIYVTNIKLAESTNIVGGSTAVGIFETASGPGAAVVSTTMPQTTTTTRAVRLNSGAYVPLIPSSQLNLKVNTNYKLEFDYWSDADNAAFDVDLFPDDLPQNMPTAQKTLQHYSWEFSSNSANMAAAQLRFFNDRAIPNPSNIYITNIKLNETLNNIGTNEEYYYIYNAQGDVTGLFDKTGARVVSYTYDTWGKLISTTGDLASTIGVKNPYRYRGYRYDTETGLYYLQSRYYNPEWGRFINVDDVNSVTATLTDLTDKNLFSYCDNNPITRTDSNGYFWETFFDVASLGQSAYNLASKPSWANAGYLAWDVAATAIPFVPGSYTAKTLKAARSKAVKNAWKAELQLIKETGEGSVNWSSKQFKELKKYGKVKGYVGHHMKSVKGYPHLAGDHKNIEFLTRSQHYSAHGGGKWRVPTHGPYSK
jgi:RHS repeat-associated protein